MFILRGRHSTLDMWFGLFLANRIVHDTVQIAWQAWGIVRVSFCVVGAAFSACTVTLTGKRSIWDAFMIAI